MVRLRVALHADMRKYLAPGEKGPREMSLPAGATVADLLAALAVPETEIVTVGVNGVLAGRDSVLADGDEVTMFSPMEGG
jgi:sulfur carrier protein ThiS